MTLKSECTWYALMNMHRRVAIMCHKLHLAGCCLLHFKHSIFDSTKVVVTSAPREIG